MSSRLPHTTPGSDFQFYTECASQFSAPDAGVLVAVIPSGITRKSQLFQVLRAQLKLPEYFGDNWDALDECLRDWSWLEGYQRVRLMHADIPFQPGRRSRRIYLQILQDALPMQPDDFRLEVLFPACDQNGVLAALQTRREPPA